jgi:gamma-glutamyltranspeptidase/glutathione hydrolase
MSIDFGMPVDAALAQARFHHQWRPDQLKIERKAAEQVIAELRRRGHDVEVVNSIGAAQAVGLDAGGKRLLGTHDPRGEGKALGL